MSRKGPVIIDQDDLPQAQTTPAEAPPVPDPGLPQGRAMTAATRIAARRPSRLTRAVLWAATALITIAIGTAAWDFAFGLLARNVWLGRTALALGAIVALGILVFAARELAGISRLARIDRLQSRVRAAMTGADRAAATAALTELDRLYAPREDMRDPRANLSAHTGDILDPDALIATAERHLMTPLDAAARLEIEAAARQVAAGTALVPLALADVAIALSVNIRMIRRIAEIYAGRAGTLGSLRLLRSVAAHLIATGAVAVGDDLVGSVAGGGLVSKLSRRFGEGVVNGALTARVGIAAMEVCRPMPFSALDRPRVTRLIQRALTGLFGTNS